MQKFFVQECYHGSGVDFLSVNRPVGSLFGLPFAGGNGEQTWSAVDPDCQSSSCDTKCCDVKSRPGGNSCMY